MSPVCHQSQALSSLWLADMLDLGIILPGSWGLYQSCWMWHTSKIFLLHLIHQVQLDSTPCTISTLINIFTNHYLSAQLKEEAIRFFSHVTITWINIYHCFNFFHSKCFLTVSKAFTDTFSNIELTKISF